MQKQKSLSYFDAVDPVAHMEEWHLRCYIVHDKDTISFPQILSAYAAILLLPCTAEKVTKKSVELI